DDVVLIGGTTQVPMVRRQLAAVFGRPIAASAAADLAVLKGAPVLAASHAPVGLPPQPQRPSLNARASGLGPRASELRRRPGRRPLRMVPGCWDYGSMPSRRQLARYVALPEARGLN